MSFFRQLLDWLASLFSSAGGSIETPSPPEEAPSELFRDPQLTANFHIDEFACNDGTPVPAELYANVLELARNLQVLRDSLGRPIKILDGYRTVSYNRKIGGTAESLHLECRAADVAVGQDPHIACVTAQALTDRGKMKRGGIGIYPTFVHYDTRGKNIRWVGHE